MHAFSARYDAALKLAALAHTGQTRKGTDVPYIAHTVHVAAILERHGFGEELVLAGLLHDVVEDTDVPLAAIRAAFGDEVARLVAAVSEPTQPDGSPLPWAERKAAKLALVRDGGVGAAALKAADAIHNAQSTAADVRNDGPSVWQRFTRTPTQIADYYASVAAIVEAALPDHPITAELRDAVADVAALATE